MTPLAALGHGFWRVLVPTAAQALAAVFLALAAIVSLQSHLLLDRLGISTDAIDAAGSQFADRFGAVLSSPVTDKVVLVAFWSAVGLIIYLICWGAYNMLIAARNEVALETQYINRSHWDGPWGALVVKSLSALLALAYITTFSYGLSVWIALAAPIFQTTTLEAALMAVMAVLGLAVQLYSLLVIVQLLFTPWYTNSPFTVDED